MSTSLSHKQNEMGSSPVQFRNWTTGELKLLGKLTGSSRTMIFVGHPRTCPDQPLIAKLSVPSGDSLNEALFYLSTLSPANPLRFELLKNLPNSSKYPLLQHANLVPCRGIEITDQYISFILEKAPLGDLFDFLQHSRQSCLSESQARIILSQLLDVLSYLHRSGIVHRDLKLENILLVDKQLKIYLSDFEYATPFRPGVFLTDRCGTPVYGAPEMYKKSYVGPEVDIWATGVMLYCLVCGCFPFTQDQLERIASMNTFSGHEELSRELKFPKTVSKDFVSLIRKIFSVRVEDRPTAEQLLDHPWFQHRRPAPSTPAIATTTPTPTTKTVLTTNNNKQLPAIATTTTTMRKTTPNPMNKSLTPPSLSLPRPSSLSLSS